MADLHFSIRDPSKAVASGSVTIASEATHPGVGDPTVSYRLRMVPEYPCFVSVGDGAYEFVPRGQEYVIDHYRGGSPITVRGKTQ